MVGLILQSGVTHGFRVRDWSDSLRALEAGQKMPSLIPLALAKQPQDSVEACFQWAVDMEDKRIGKILEDGSIDLRERSRAPSVTEGDLIGSFTPAAWGESGRDVLEREIAPPRSQAFEVTCGQQTREEVRGDKTFFLRFNEWRSNSRRSDGQRWASYASSLASKRFSGRQRRW